MSQYFPTPSSHKENIKVEIDLSNYATKKEINDITHVDTSNFALKTNLANSKTEVDKLDIGKLATVPVDLSKLSNVVKNEVVKKTEYDKLVAKVNNIDTSRFLLKTKYAADKTELEKKIPDTSGFVKKTDYSTKIDKIKDKIPDISNLETKTALTTVENKVPSTSNLVKKTDYNAKITEIEKKLTDHKHDKYITTPEFHKLAADVFNARLAHSNLITKTDFDTKLSSLNRKITSNKKKHLFNEKKLQKLNTYDLSYFRGKNYFDEDGTQNYYIFQPISKYLKVVNVNDIDYILSWKSRGLNDVEIESIKTNNYLHNPRMDIYNTSKIRIKFNGSF